MDFRKHLAILGPLILTSDLLLLLGGEIVGDVERLSDLLGGFALDHVGDGLASDVKEGLDVKIVRGLWEDVSLVLLNGRTKVAYQDDLKEHLLVNLHKLLIPLLDICGLFAGVGIIVDGGRRIVLVVLAPFNDLFKDRLIDLSEM